MEDSDQLSGSNKGKNFKSFGDSVLFRWKRLGHHGGKHTVVFCLEICIDSASSLNSLKSVFPNSAVVDSLNLFSALRFSLELSLNPI